MTAANNLTFNPEKYATIASNHLVVYALYFLYKDGDEIRAEDIISACFTLFPKKFSLRTYPQWPDSALVGRRLHDCQKSGWLTAKIETGFKLTAKGIRLAEKVAEELGAEIRRKEKPIEKARVAEAKKSTGGLEVDKLQTAETAEPASAASKPTTEKAKSPVVEEPKPLEKVAAPAARTPASEAKKPAEKKAAAPAAKASVTEAPKPAPVKPKPAKKVKAADFKTQKPAEKKIPVKAKPAKKEKVPAAKAPKPAEKKTAAPAKPAAVKPKPAKKKVLTATKPAFVKPKPTEKAESFGTKTPKSIEKKVAASVAKPAPVKSKPSEKAKSSVVETPKPVEKKVAPIAKPSPAKLKPAEKAKSPVVEAQKLAEKKTAVKPGAKAAPPSIIRRPPPVIPAPSAEEKAKAGKFVKMMETSDAYRLYKKNGAKANIGEFDFRSLLLCTMESSHETLARNVELFKSYAEMHNRKDLTAFLAFCGEKFGHLLAPEKKTAKKFKR